MARRRRRRGTGTVFPRGGKWVAQATIQDGARRRFISRVRPTERAAELALQGLLNQLAIGADPAAEEQTLDAWLTAWLRRIHPPVVRPTTWTSYEGHVRIHISPLLGGLPLAKLRTPDVDRLARDRLAAGLAPATIVRILTTLTMALEVAVSDGVLVRNVASHARRPKVEREPVGAMTPAQAKVLLETIRGDEHEALFATLLGSGLRRGEALGLDWRDVDLAEGVIRIRRSKTARGVRAIPVGRLVVEALRAQRARSPRVGPNEPVFLGPRSGERLRGDSVLHHWHQLLERAGLPPMRLHDLRHGFATLSLRQGAHIREISDHLGHSTPTITHNIYAHAQPDAQRAMVDALDELVGS